MNGKSIEVDSTDAEGRLVLSGMIPFSGIMWLNWKNHCFSPSRRYLLHGQGIQATHFDRCGNPRVIILLTLCMIDVYLNPRSMIIALGEVYTGVFSVLFYSIYNCFDDILIANWCRIRTSSGMILKQLALLSMIVSGVCLLTMSLVLRSILQTQISKMYSITPPFFLGSFDELRRLICIQLYRRAEEQQEAALPLFSWNLLQNSNLIMMVLRNLLWWNGLISIWLAPWRYPFFFYWNTLMIYLRTKQCTRPTAYQEKGMTGRPVR